MVGNVEIKKYFLALILIFRPTPQYIPPRKAIIVYPYIIITSNTWVLLISKLSIIKAIINGIKPLNPNILASFSFVLYCLVVMFFKLCIHHCS